VNRPTQNQVSRMRKQLADLQRQENWVDSEAISKLKNEIQAQMDREGLWWHQRAKMDWLKHEDRNTKYFHSCANSRRKKNFIGKIKDERVLWRESIEGVNSAFVDYFSELFSLGQGGDLDPCMRHVKKSVSESMNATLVEDFTADEINTALRQMAHLKAPRLDGMSACFFQQNWALIGMEVCRGILKILNCGVTPSQLNLTYIALIPKKQNPKCVNEFRPINLCNMLYKLVSNVLANRLKKKPTTYYFPYLKCLYPWSFNYG
jgi:hypothetical protein